MNPRTTCLMIGAFLFVSAGLPMVSLGQQAEEYALKASYVERFMQFVNWPVQKDEIPSHPFVINVLGKNPFNGGLEDVFANRTSDDREIQIDYISEVDEAVDCDVLFLARSEKNELSEIMEKVSDKPILTIGDTEGFSKAGVIINFYIDGNRLHFKINIKAARKSGLEIDPFLLDYAQIEDSSEDPEDES